MSSGIPKVPPYPDAPTAHGPHPAQTGLLCQTGPFWTLLCTLPMLPGLSVSKHCLGLLSTVHTLWGVRESVQNQPGSGLPHLIQLLRWRAMNLRYELNALVGPELTLPPH